MPRKEPGHPPRSFFSRHTVELSINRHAKITYQVRMHSHGVEDLNPTRSVLEANLCPKHPPQVSRPEAGTYTCWLIPRWDSGCRLPALGSLDGFAVQHVSTRRALVPWTS